MDGGRNSVAQSPAPSEPTASPTGAPNGAAADLECIHLDVPSHIGLFFVWLVIGLFLVSLAEISPHPGAGGLALPTFLVAPVLGIAAANTLTRLVRQRCTRHGTVGPGLCRRYDVANSLLGSLTALLLVHAVFVMADGLCTRLFGLNHPLCWIRHLTMPVSIAACAGYATWRIRRRTWILGPAATTLWLSALLLITHVTDQDLGMDPSKPLIAVLATVFGTGIVLVCRYGWNGRPTPGASL